MAVNKPEYIEDEAGNSFKMSYVIMNPDTKEFYNKKQDGFTPNMAAASTDRYAEWAFNSMDNKTSEQIDGLVAVGTYRDESNRIHPVDKAFQFNAATNDMSVVDAHELFPGEDLLNDRILPVETQPLRHVGKEVDPVKYEAEDVSTQYEQLDLNLDGLDNGEGLQR